MNYMNTDIQSTIASMTLEEKAAMIRGKDFWNTEMVERLGVPSIPIFKEASAGSPLVEALSSGGDQGPMMRMIEALPVAKLVSLSGGLVDEKRLDDLVSLINSKTGD
jgi:hypothetical protein